MVVERAYRREALTIGALSAELAVPEYRLRQLINEGLGHRNFNAFLNRYRIEEAKVALGDPEQKEVPVLTIAMRRLCPTEQRSKNAVRTTPGVRQVTVTPLPATSAASAAENEFTYAFDA